MAAANNGRRFTRSRKTTTPDDLTEKPAYAPKPRSLRLSKTASTGIALKDNCAVVIPKLLSENTNKLKKIEKPERQSPSRKRTRVDNGDASRDVNDSKNKRTRLTAQKETETRDTRERASSRKEKEAQSTSKQRTTKKRVVFTEESQDSFTLSEVESEDQESSSDSKSESGLESESGMVSGEYSSSTFSSTSPRESDSPVPTSELSDSSEGIESSSDESSSSEDVLRWRTRKSPRKLAQAKSREKIAELCKPESDDTLSPLSSDSSYSE